MGYTYSSSEAEYVGFEFSSFWEGATIAEHMLSADELFCDGKLRPLAKMHDWSAPIIADLLVEEAHFVGSDDSVDPNANEGLCSFSSPLPPTSCLSLSHGGTDEKGRNADEWGSPKCRPALIVSITEMGSNAGECGCLSPSPTARLGASKAENWARPFTDAESVHFAGDGLSQQGGPANSDESLCLVALPTSSGLLFAGQEAAQVEKASIWGLPGNTQALISSEDRLQDNVEMKLSSMSALSCRDAGPPVEASCSGIMNASRGELNLNRINMHSSKFTSATCSSGQISLNSAASFTSSVSVSSLASTSSILSTSSSLTSSSSLAASSSLSVSLPSPSLCPLSSSSASSSSLITSTSASSSSSLIPIMSPAALSSLCLTSPSSPPFSALPLPPAFSTLPSSPPFSPLPSSSSSRLTSPSSPPFSPFPSSSSSLSSSCSLSPSSSSSSLSKDNNITREPHPSSRSRTHLTSEQSTYTSCSCRFPLRSLWPFSKSKEASYSCIKSSQCTSVKPQGTRRKHSDKNGSKNQSSTTECQVSSKIPSSHPRPSPTSPRKSSASKTSRARAIRQSRHTHAVMVRSNSKHPHTTSKNASCQGSKDSPMILVKDERRRSCDYGRSSPPMKRNSSLNARKNSPTHTQRVKKVSSGGGNMGMQMDLGAYASKKGAYTPSIRVTPVLSIVPGCIGPSFNKTRSSLAKPTSKGCM